MIVLLCVDTPPVVEDAALQFIKQEPVELLHIKEEIDIKEEAFESHIKEEHDSGMGFVVLSMIAR